MEEEEVREHREKIESKGAYSYDLHKALRRVSDALGNGNVRKSALRLEALRDICAPEIREAVNEEWLEIDNKYRDWLKKIETADFRLSDTQEGWQKDRYDKHDIYYYRMDKVHAPQELKDRVAEGVRRNYLNQIKGQMLHEKFQACINCLDRHGELRKWREVEYGRI